MLFTALICGFPMKASSQTANLSAFDVPIELKLGGYMTWYSVYANQNNTTLINSSQTVDSYNNADIFGDAEIYFSGKTRLRNGVEIGALVQLEAGTDSSTSSHVIDQAYMTLDSKYGRLIMGNVKNVSDQMSVTAPTSSVIGLQDTDFTRMVLIPETFSVNLATYAALDDISTKLSYITPSFNDLTFAISLMPGNKKKGKDNNALLINTESGSSSGVKLFRYGLSTLAYYEKNFGKFGIETSASYTMYKPNLKANGVVGVEKNINEYGAGLNILKGNWTIGGSYNYTNMSKETAAFVNSYETVAKGYSWDAGVMYTIGPFETSLGFFQSKANSLLVEDKKDVYNIYQLSLKYKVISGVDIFMDTAYVEFDSASSDRQRSNKGPAVAVGFDLTF